MSIRFKFRSAVNFDSVDIEGRPSISVGDLRSKIVRHKNLNICQDFNLIFSDAITGHEYNENFQIPIGSSVIIKRVPARSVPCAMAHTNSIENVGMKDSNPVNPTGSLPLVAETDNFDDFGVDLCPVPDATLSDYDLEFDTNCVNNEKSKNTVPRGPKLEASDLSDVIPKGSIHNGKEGYTPHTKVEPDGEEHMKSQNVVNVNYPAVQNADFPSELKCSLCNTFFKEAVMIPCCQHSFCGKCICEVLHEKARCPKCYSSKCRIEDLLPNLSLRQAIEHFLESQILTCGADNALHNYAPDGESGIQVKDVSCAVTILQREPNMPVSPSATGKGSNQIMGESVYDSRIINNVSLGGSCSHHTSKFSAAKALKSDPLVDKVKQLAGERCGYAHHVDFKSGAVTLEAVPDFQGESQPHDLPQIGVHEEVDSSINQKEGVWVNTGGGDRSFMASGRHKKGDRTCYMCGSPYHFIRDCPAASSPHPMLQTGNAMFPGAMPGHASPFWNGTQLLSMRSHMYGNSGMMPFNSAMVPASRFAIPPYMPSMYGGLPILSGFMGMGGMAPQARTGSICPLTHSDTLELGACAKRWSLSKDNFGSGQPCDDEEDYYNKEYRHNGTERSHEHKYRGERDVGASFSEDSFPRRSQMKHHCDKYLDHDNHSVDERHEKSSRSTIAGSDWSDRRQYYRERSNSGVEDVPHSSDRHSEERHKHHHRSSKKHGSYSSRSRDQTKAEKYVGRKRVEHEIEGPYRKHHSHSESGLEPCSSAYQKKKNKDIDYDPGHISRHSRRSGKPISCDLYSDRWQMASGSDEDCGEGHRYPKRKRVH
ncbi:E3 ubiquitin-protein like [Actinidia chinensis var. chinensis]|uniref:E3 ubiquitin-protein like n=1 Tax=Actinidia chinensis var. chinensis TaxID=1590841 RepID=A0A2R6QYY3_ACTCC|nr:E3 ubiquitin-protein like [Actinidia chinensis var. chinensis]